MRNSTRAVKDMGNTKVGESLHQVRYFPYLSMHGIDEITYGPLVVWNSSTLPDRISSEKVRSLLQSVLESHRIPGGLKGGSKPLPGVGVISAGGEYLKPFDQKSVNLIAELRSALFLSCLAHNVRQSGPNAGHAIYTAENFLLVTQNLAPGSKFISESTGVLVRFTHMGYRLGDVEFPTPGYVPRPDRFRHDGELLKTLWKLRRSNRTLYRRLIGSATIFLESYYNTESVDLRARVLLQAAAFELLLELPESNQRLAFKEAVEHYCNNKSDRKYRYKFATRGGPKPESRTQKGIWADRFYTLRNRIVHGDNVRPADYVYRNAQHHLNISPLFFMMIVRRMAASAFGGGRTDPKFFDRIDWVKRGLDDDLEEQSTGFRFTTDFEALIADRLDL